MNPLRASQIDKLDKAGYADLARKIQEIVDVLNERDEQYEEKNHLSHNCTEKRCYKEEKEIDGKKYKMTFEVVCDFDRLVDKDVFDKEYDNDIYKICKYMYESNGLSWFDEDLRLTKAEFIP